MGIHPALVVVGDPNEVGTEDARDVLDLTRHLPGRLHGHAILGPGPMHGEGIEEALASVLPFLQLGEDVRQVP